MRSLSGGNGVKHQAVRGNHDVVADPNRTEHCRLGTDHHPVADHGVAAFARGSGVVPPESQCAQGHLLVEGHVVADHRGLADHHALAVVDEEPPADPRTGVDLHTGEDLRDVGQQPRSDPVSLTGQPVRDPVQPDRGERGMAERLQGGSDRRVAGHHGRDVLTHQEQQPAEDVHQVSSCSALAQSSLVPASANRVTTSWSGRSVSAIFLAASHAAAEEEPM